MIRPAKFCLNTQTAESNAFQNALSAQVDSQKKALTEFDRLVGTLRLNNIKVIVIDDTPVPHTPDSVFPNNWISFHENGQIFLYPMLAGNRRQERRMDIIDSLGLQFKIEKIEDLSYFELTGRYLEGTGSMVLDRENQIAYACRSPRTSLMVLEEFCKLSGYQFIMFDAADEAGKAIYHTNVLMCIGEKFVVICLEAIPCAQDRTFLLNLFYKTNKEVIEISIRQMVHFSGNMLEVINDCSEYLLVMSNAAFDALNEDQINRLKKFCRIVSSDISTIEELGGGSVRCMLAEIKMPTRDN